MELSLSEIKLQEKSRAQPDTESASDASTQKTMPIKGQEQENNLAADAKDNKKQDDDKADAPCDKTSKSTPSISKKRGYSQQLTESRKLAKSWVDLIVFSHS